MTFYVIGNGFDLHYGLNTTYSNFKVFLLENGYWELVSKVDQLFFERGNFSQKTLTLGPNSRICYKSLTTWMPIVVKNLDVTQD